MAPHDEREVAEHLEHLRRSLANRRERLVVEPTGVSHLLRRSLPPATLSPPM